MEKPPDTTASNVPPTAISEDYRQLLVDLFGVMAYGEMSGFERLSSDARFSPTLADRRALGTLAVVEFQHFDLVAAHLQTLGSNVETAMEPFVDSINAFHERTRPGDWFESLMKAYVMDAVSGDFYREIAALLDPATQALVVRIHTAENQNAFLRTRLQSALAEDQRLASRLALWGRRLVGEALTRTRRVSIERGVVGRMFQGQDSSGRQNSSGRQDKELLEAEISRIFARLTRNHSQRMNALKLTA